MQNLMTPPEQQPGEDAKKPRLRLIIDLESPELLAALKLRVAKESVRRLGEEVSKSDIVNEILRAALAPELRERTGKRKP